MASKFMSPSKLFALLALFALQVTSETPSGVTRAEPIGADRMLAERLHELLEVYEQHGFSGSVLVSQGGEVVLERGYGYANRATGEKNTAATHFDFASIAKTFTGAAVLALEADGLLSIGDPLARSLGPFPEKKTSATIHHLATHKAGLAHRSLSDLDYSTDRSIYVQSMKDAPFESAPGSAYRYTNAGTSLLAAVVEEVAGRPFEAFVRERLFAVAGLEATGFYPDTERGQEGLAFGYLDASKTPAPAEYDDWTWGAIGSTGVVSTVGDIHRWFVRLHAGQVLPAAQTAEAFDPGETEAFGWHTETDEQGRTFIHKGGGLRAMQTQILAYPDQETVVVWAHNNMARNWRRALNRGLSAIALGDPYVLPLAIAAPRAPAAGLDGWWQTADGTALELIAEPSGLRAGGNGFGLPSAPLSPAAEGVWSSFDVENVSSLVLAQSADGALRIVLAPEDEEHILRRAAEPPAALVALTEPSVQALVAARRVAGWALTGEVEPLWKASAYRPLRGPYSRVGWRDRLDFIARRVGTEVRVVEEAWARRDGSWRYWRTLEGSAGVVVVLRLELSRDGQVLGVGINPQGSEPEPDAKELVAVSTATR